MSAYKIHELTGEAIEPWLDQIGHLRMEVFREFPYLYDGDPIYERNYLKRYLEAKDALVVLVVDALDRVIGVTTCLPMSEEGAEFHTPFMAAEMDLAEICYFGESLLLPQWRGKGMGRLFFDRREAHARKLGCRIATFCAVDRPDDHPMRPDGYRPLDEFWSKRGYEKQNHLKTHFPWKEVGAAEESEQTLTFWTKTLSP